AGACPLVGSAEISFAACFLLSLATVVVAAVPVSILATYYFSHLFILYSDEVPEEDRYVRLTWQGATCTAVGLAVAPYFPWIMCVYFLERLCNRRLVVGRTVLLKLATRFVMPYLLIWFGLVAWVGLVALCFWIIQYGSYEWRVKFGYALAYGGFVVLPLVGLGITVLGVLRDAASLRRACDGL
ncbi:MAG: hypothetical protein NTX87_09830, partial [Planctomycetota bacterium]|nr:hypothetical protein [Planctomycetota bacterium]